MLVLHAQPTLKHGISGQQLQSVCCGMASHKLFNTLCMCQLVIALDADFKAAKEISAICLY
jgi:hypothetical protein